MTGRPPIYLPSSQSRADKRYHWGTWQECSIPARRLKDHRSCDSDWTTHVFSTEYSWTTQAFRPNLNVSNRSNTNVSNRPNTVSRIDRIQVSRKTREIAFPDSSRAAAKFISPARSAGYLQQI